MCLDRLCCRNAGDWEFLEGEHAYIQWMFPLEVKSGMVSRAPIVTPEDKALFAKDKELQVACSITESSAWPTFLLKADFCPMTQRLSHLQDLSRILSQGTLLGP